MRQDGDVPQPQVHPEVVLQQPPHHHHLCQQLPSQHHQQHHLVGKMLVMAGELSCMLVLHSSTFGHVSLQCVCKGPRDHASTNGCTKTNGATNPESILHHPEFRILVCLLFSL